MLRVPLLLVVTLLLVSVANAQSATDAEECGGPVYKAREVSRRAKILFYPPPEMPSDKRASEVDGQVILDVILCSNGKVTNITVAHQQPYGLTEAAMKAARKIKFRAAEKDGLIVSQRMRLEYSFKM